MAILLEPPADLLTYEAFMADPTVRGRCDIVVDLSGLRRSYCGRVCGLTDCLTK